MPIFAGVKVLLGFLKKQGDFITIPKYYMEKGAKILRLCSALIQKGWAKTLLAELKAEKGAKHKLSLLLSHIMQNHDTKGKPLRKSWSLDAWESEHGNLPKTLWELKGIIDEFLLNQRKVSEYQLYRKMELFYMYRDLGLHKDNAEHLQQIEALLNDTHDKHLALLFAQFKQEVALLTHEKTQYAAELSTTFYLYWVSEALFDACMKSSNSFPKDKVEIPSLEIPFLRSFIQQSALLQADNAIKLYLLLYDFLQLPQVSTQDAIDFEAQIHPLLAFLSPIRKRDIISLIGNKFVYLFSTHKTALYAQLAWKYTLSAFENGWGYVGNNIEFKAYRNLILLCIAANEDSETPQTFAQRLLFFKEKYEKHVAFPPKDNKMKLLFQFCLDWKLCIHLEHIYETNPAIFTEKAQKAEMLLYQLKAGYTLFCSGNEKYADFWDWVAEKFKKKSFWEQKPYQIEFLIWKNLMQIHFATKARPDCVEELQKIQVQFSDNTYIYHDRKWYLALIDAALNHV